MTQLGVGATVLSDCPAAGAWVTARGNEPAVVISLVRVTTLDRGGLSLGWHGDDRNQGDRAGGSASGAVRGRGPGSRAVRPESARAHDAIRSSGCPGATNLTLLSAARPRERGRRHPAAESARRDAREPAADRSRRRCPLPAAGQSQSASSRRRSTSTWRYPPPPGRTAQDPRWRPRPPDRQTKPESDQNPPQNHPRLNVAVPRARSRSSSTATA